MISQLVLYFAVGKIVIFLFQKAKPSYTFLEKFRFLKELFECDLCLGVWVYSFLALLLHMNFFDGFWYYPVFSEILTGMVASFVMHVFSVGWKEKFSTIVLS